MELILREGYLIKLCMKLITMICLDPPRGLPPFVSLLALVTQRPLLAGAYGPGKVTHTRQAKEYGTRGSAVPGSPEWE
jgi:hypothetical protein